MARHVVAALTAPAARTALLACVASMTASPAAALPLAPGQSMEVRFTQPGPPGFFHPSLPADHPWRILDTVQFVLNAAYISGFGPPVVHVDIFDGTTRLGGYDTSFSYPFTLLGFTGPGSLFTFASTPVTTLQGFQDATIQGRLVITNVTQPAPGFNLPAPTFDVSIAAHGLGHAISTNGYITFGPLPVIGTQTLLAAVPEPATAALLGAGLLGLGLARRRRAA